MSNATRMRIQVAASEAKRWSQFAYQFAHEFGHVMANFREPLVHPRMWLEETICEVASIFAIRDFHEFINSLERGLS